MFYTFFDFKNAQIKKERPSSLVNLNFFFHAYPPKNASKYPKIAILKLTFTANATYTACFIFNKKTITGNSILFIIIGTSEKKISCPVSIYISLKIINLLLVSNERRFNQCSGLKVMYRVHMWHDLKFRTQSLGTNEW